MSDVSSGATGTVQLENEQFRVTRWTIQPGGVIPMHVHELEYVVVPVADCTLHVTNADGSEITAELVVGESYTRPAGSEHQVENRSVDVVVDFVEVERF